MPKRTLSQKEKADPVAAKYPREIKVVPGGILMCKLWSHGV